MALLLKLDLMTMSNFKTSPKYGHCSVFIVQRCFRSWKHSPYGERSYSFGHVKSGNFFNGLPCWNRLTLTNGMLWFDAARYNYKA